MSSQPISRFGRTIGRFVTMAEPERREPPPHDQVVLEWSNAENEMSVSFDRFPPRVPAPAAIVVVVRGPNSTSVVRLDCDFRDEAGRLTYIGGRSTASGRPHSLTCADCRTLPDRLYLHKRLWRCKRCWLRALGVLVADPIAPTTDKET